MTYSMIVGKYKLMFSDTHFKDFRKKPTISVYDADTNSETKIASFNSQETFEWFVEAVVKADRKTENSSEKPNNSKFKKETEIWNFKFEKLLKIWKGVANDMEADKGRTDCSSRDEVVE